MVLKKIKKFSSYYLAAHSQRLKLTHPTWRLFFVLAVAVGVLFVNDYLQVNYAAVVEANGKLRYLPDALFNWFMTGLVLGILTLALLYEGEFILSLKHMVKDFEGEAGEKISKARKKRR